ncbi:Mrp/NBP35 family ATP-binding protein [Anaerolineales bacterium HSG25]|nr:Mrp/NBP35 family ATP-binding protein [Anaerolineales bacterium HSG25]
MVTEQQILTALKGVVMPDLQKDIVTLDMVKQMVINGTKLDFTVILPPAATEAKGMLEEKIMAALRTVPDITDVSVRFTTEVPRDGRLMGKTSIGVRNTIAVASGKGGVGKSTMSTNLAISLALDGAKVGLLDADIYGPNVPLMMGINERPKGGGGQQIQPLEAYGVKLMSMGFLVNPGDALIWRGPMVHNALRQFLEEIDWQGLDYLVVDLPPGTGDVSLSLSQSVGLTGAVIVTTPQKVALSDVVRGVGMFKQLEVPILGVIENMSYFEAPDTGKRHYIFGNGGGVNMAQEAGIDFLGEVPLEPDVRIGGDEGQPIVVRDPASTAAQSIRVIARKVAAEVAARNLAQESGSGQSEPTLSILN